MIALIDYGAGNLHSVQNALDYIGCESCITSDAKVLMEADAAILPGVGSLDMLWSVCKMQIWYSRFWILFTAENHF